jgi:hypothetical protein
MTDEQMVVRRRAGGHMLIPVLDQPLAAQQVQIDGLMAAARTLPVTFAQADAAHTELRAAIAQVAEVVAELTHRPPVEMPSPTPVDLGPLQEAVAALQASVATQPPPPDLAPYEARLAAIEATLAQLVATLPPGLPPTPGKRT